jgi:DNA-binding NarL/FixJ family response regulator
VSGAIRLLPPAIIFQQPFAEAHAYTTQLLAGKMNKRSTSNCANPASEVLPGRKHFHGKRVVIVDDHPLVRQGLERMIHSENGFIVCGEAGDADEAVEVVRRTRPDLAIVDIGLPGRDGIDLTRQLVREFPGLAILVLSMHEESDYAKSAIEAGAYGYMVKNDAVEKIGMALEKVLERKVYLSPGIRDSVLLNTERPTRNRCSSRVLC